MFLYYEKLKTHGAELPSDSIIKKDYTPPPVTGSDAL